MAYWGSKPIDSDFATGAIGAYIYLLKERLQKDTETVLKKCHPEQSIVASLTCLRLLSEQFPKNVRVHFGRKDYLQSKEAFEQWYDAVRTKLPAKYRDEILDEANKEFALFEERVLI